MRRGWAALLAVALSMSACSGSGDNKTARAAGVTSTSTSPTTSAPTTSTTTTTTIPAPPPRRVFEQAWTPFAVTADITLQHPAGRVELVGFHQSNHEGAQTLMALPSAASPTTLESRERLTTAQTAADVVVDPEAEIRAPVTGTVKRAGGYVLYCKYRDDFAVFAPDSHPSWEVKILHIDGVQVRAGQRVVAGETVVAPRATKLPFESQVDEVSAEPHWPHVHIEVVNPAIPNRPSPGGGCS